MPSPRESAGCGRPAGRPKRAQQKDVPNDPDPASATARRRRVVAGVFSATLLAGVAAASQTLAADALGPADGAVGGADAAGAASAAPHGLSVVAFEERLGLRDPVRRSQLRAAARGAAQRRADARAHAAAVGDELAIGRMVAAGDRIARLPYVYGGGHGSFSAAGYDCSGSVSYVLHAAGLIDTPLDSSGLESYGDPGPGRHVTIYANPGHALMTIDGRRYDTIAFQETGTRWSDSVGSTSGYVVRHPPGM
jgi:cell wall-associated NlpC family hydrolase